jgi:hypothetical protein
MRLAGRSRSGSAFDPVQEEIAKFQRDIEARSSEIKRLQVDLEETFWAKEWLVRAEKHTTD